jgi:hypothetical protein
MASNRHLIAVRWHEGKYFIIGDQIFNSAHDIDWRALEEQHRWNNVSIDSGYKDDACVLSIAQITSFARSEVARSYIERTQKAGAFLYLIHRAEYESSMC